METFDKLEWRRHGAMNASRRYKPTTSTGRVVRIIGIYPPRKGQLYLKPSGVKGVFNVLVAQNDHAKRNYCILEERGQ